jgi:hypothetical protein
LNHQERQEKKITNRKGAKKNYCKCNFLICLSINHSLRLCGSQKYLLAVLKIKPSRRQLAQKCSPDAIRESVADSIPDCIRAT